MKLSKVTLTPLMFSSLFLVLSLGCSSKSVHNESATKSNSTPTANTAAAVVTPAAEVAMTNPSAEARTTEPKPNVNHAPKEAHHAEAHAEHRKAGEVPADKALTWLKNGNSRFLKGFLRKDGTAKADLERLTAGQKPHSIILSCSDSRVPPEVIFDQKLGEVFVIRTAGENPDAAVIASVEYAVEHLGSNLIVVMGHESCGAVKAALQTPENQSAGSPFLDRLVSQIRPRVIKSQRTTASTGFIEEGWDNVHGVADELVKKSEIIRDAVASGSVKIQQALYHLGSGKVEWEQGTVK